MNLKTTEAMVIGDISKETALAMIKAANDSALSQRSSNSNIAPVTHCVWFSLEQINRMVTILNHEKLVGMGTDGVRVYFGKYSFETAPDEHKEYADRDTILFVSTKAHPNGSSHMDYFEHFVVEPPKEMVPENRGELCEPKSACIGSQFE